MIRSGPWRPSAFAARSSTSSTIPGSMSAGSSDAARFHADGLMVIEDGRIADFGAFDEVSPRHRALEVTHHRGPADPARLHRRPYPLPADPGGRRVRRAAAAVAAGLGLPGGAQVQGPRLRPRGRARFFDNLLAGGTTTCQAFTTSAPVSAEALFDEAARRNMRLIPGLTGIDRYVPDDYANTPDEFYRESKRLIGRYHRQGAASTPSRRATRSAPRPS